MSEELEISNSVDSSIKSPSQADIDSIDINSLTDTMIKGIYTLEAALFNQAAHESKRIVKLRGFIDTVEDKLYDADTISSLTTKELLQLYGLSQTSLTSSMKYLYDLHRSLTSGIEAIGTITKHKSSISKGSKEVNTDLDTVKRELGDIILAKIKEKQS